MPPSQSVRRDVLQPSDCVGRGRPTPQVSTHPRAIFIFYLNYQLFTIIYSLILRTLPYSMILWAVHASDWKLELSWSGQASSQPPTTSAGVSPRTTTQTTTQAQRTSASFALSASLPFALLATTQAQRISASLSFSHFLFALLAPSISSNLDCCCFLRFYYQNGIIIS